MALAGSTWTAIRLPSPSIYTTNFDLSGAHSASSSSVVSHIQRKSEHSFGLVCCIKQPPFPGAHCLHQTPFGFCNSSMRSNLQQSEHAPHERPSTIFATSESEANPVIPQL